ncbi:MAG: segregation/condensation protein A [Acetobacteraceae bacterium]|nr:segregation/condensation protein A [Acetobacteraceae bacterium]
MSASVSILCGRRSGRWCPAPSASSSAWRGTMSAPDALVLHLDGFEGPLDLLLDLARAQKVDLARISVRALADQFLGVIEGARRVRLELAADWLVMAAWLTWLKSRLLLPVGTQEAEEGEVAADALAARLAELQAIRAVAAWLAARPLLGHDVFARGAPEDFTEVDRSRLAADMPALIRSYVAALTRAARLRAYRPAPVTYWTIKDALARLADLVGSLPDWTSLDRFLPDALGSPLERRAALASTLVAGLELARHGELHLHQDAAFAPILVRAGGEARR